MTGTGQSVSILLRENSGIARSFEPVRTGIPLPRGWLSPGAVAGLRDSNGRAVAAQFKPVAWWSDRSVKWLLVDVLATVPANGETVLDLSSAAQLHDGAVLPPPSVQVRDDIIEVDTGPVRFHFAKRGATPIIGVKADGYDVTGDRGLRLRATSAAGRDWKPLIRRSTVEELGAVRAEVLCVGTIGPLEFELRFTTHAGSGVLGIECEIWNPRAARHNGGLWDLGDPSSVMFRDLTLEVELSGNARELAWQSAEGPWNRRSPEGWSLYQDSSGGDRWDSPNHVDRDSKPTVAFRGFRVVDSHKDVIAQGDRATPGVVAISERGWICASAAKFWQNFPKALRWDGKFLSLGLFPAECIAVFELQGGEKKRHQLMFEFGMGEPRPRLHELHAPVEVILDPVEVATSRAITNFIPGAEDPNRAHSEYVDSILAGPNAFVAKREVIDEYGWRNFGDLYADHEAVRHQGPEPFISHYNNQYDFLYGAGLQLLRSGDVRWRELLVDAARHHIDIDIYHTGEDKPAFNGGLFWHTDHHLPARTSTHRTYSALNAGNGPYGGGPSNEHNYTSGLLLYYYLTGDPQAAVAVIELADWVMNMDDGSLAFLGILDPGATGAATATVEPNYHKPGRGAGNSINALIDAFALTSSRVYLSKAEAFIQRCIHPLDDFAALQLAEPEHRWSYLVFLQVLGKYLACKRELGEIDYAFHHARESLVNYATWMAQAEIPYKDALHKVLIPSETWPAQDIRKGHILQIASLYAPEEAKQALCERAAFFHQRCLDDLLSFPTAYLTRPQVLLCVYACQYAGAVVGETPGLFSHEHDFGVPREFVRRHRTLVAAGARAMAALRSIGRLGADTLERVRGRY